MTVNQGHPLREYVTLLRALNRYGSRDAIEEVLFVGFIVSGAALMAWTGVKAYLSWVAL